MRKRWRDTTKVDLSPTRLSVRWHRGYQSQDAHFIDYVLYELPGGSGVFRGPPITRDEYLACVGAAQTFGRFVQTPFPRQISNALGVDALNLGRGGAGPTFPLNNPRLMTYINRARLAIVQVFSGRSQSNSLFKTVNDGMRGIHQLDGRELSADDFYKWFLEQDEQIARKIVAETRANYVLAMTELLKAITVPKILFWFSVRTPDYQEKWRLPVQNLWGEFPQLVNRQMIDQLRNRSDVYVECVSRRGLPQPLTNRTEDGDRSADSVSPEMKKLPQFENRYYPSPEMHEDAAELLIPVCREILLRRQD
jgi:hypothetical protein